jgi:endo-1,4-beta-xylanase
MACSMIDDLLAQESSEKISLKDLFKNHFLMGAAINQSQIFERDILDVSLIKTHFNSITPENILKWEYVHPHKEKYEFDESDKYIDYGVKNKMFIIGHTLVWHWQTPKWVFSESGENKTDKLTDKETLLRRMHDHIKTVVTRYKGKINGWDVVNEALDEDGNLRESLWFNIIGEDYITKAFEYAHEADPEAELYYNDYSLENIKKREGAVRLIKNLQLKGIRIDGVGLQGHYKMDWPTTAQLDSTIKAFSDLGVKVMITELDIDVLPNVTNNYGADISLNVELQEKLNPYKNGLPDSVQQSLAERYADLFDVFVKNSNTVSRITFWGVTDADSWLNNWPIRGRTNYPLLFDRNGKPKPAYKAVTKIVSN